MRKHPLHVYSLYLHILAVVVELRASGAQNVASTPTLPENQVLGPTPADGGGVDGGGGEGGGGDGGGGEGGGNRRYEYVGCFRDVDWTDPSSVGARDFPLGPHAGGHDGDGCMATCAGFNYFALQAQGWCACGNGYGVPVSRHPKLDDSDCGGAWGSGGTAANAVYFRHSGAVGPSPAETKCRYLDSYLFSEEYTQLMSAVVASGIIIDLTSQGYFSYGARLTVFAPTTEALEAADVFSGGIEDLGGRLMHHIVNGAIRLSDYLTEVGQEMFLISLNGDKIHVSRSEEGLVLDGKVAVLDEVKACDGVLYRLDRLLEVPEAPAEPSVGASYICEPGMTKKDSTYVASTGDNSREACTAQCNMRPDCVAFDWTSKNMTDACRMVYAGHSHVTDGGGDHREYCSKESVAPICKTYADEIGTFPPTSQLAKLCNSGQTQGGDAGGYYELDPRDVATVEHCETRLAPGFACGTAGAGQRGEHSGNSTTFATFFQALSLERSACMRACWQTHMCHCVEFEHPAADGSATCRLYTSTFRSPVSARTRSTSAVSLAECGGGAARAAPSPAPFTLSQTMWNPSEWDSRTGLVCDGGSISVAECESAARGASPPGRIEGSMELADIELAPPGCSVYTKEHRAPSFSIAGALARSGPLHVVYNERQFDKIRYYEYNPLGYLAGQNVSWSTEYAPVCHRGACGTAQSATSARVVAPFTVQGDHVVVPKWGGRDSYIGPGEEGRGYVEFLFRVAKPGLVQFSFELMPTIPDGQNFDSLSFSVDDGPEYEWNYVLRGGNPTHFSWKTQRHKYTLLLGIHTLRVWERGDGAMLRGAMIMQGSDYTCFVQSVSYSVSRVHHCGGVGMDALEDGTRSGWQPGSGGVRACEEKCDATTSCTAFEWRDSDSACIWRTGAAHPWLLAQTNRMEPGYHCYVKAGDRGCQDFESLMWREDFSSHQAMLYALFASNIFLRPEQGSYTVFLTSNQDLETILGARAGLTHEQLVAYVNLHMLEGTLTLDDLERAGTVRSLAGMPVHVTRHHDDGSLWLTRANHTVRVLTEARACNTSIVLLAGSESPAGIAAALPDATDMSSDHMREPPESLRLQDCPFTRARRCSGEGLFTVDVDQELCKAVCLQTFRGGGPSSRYACRCAAWDASPGVARRCQLHGASDTANSEEPMTEVSSNATHPAALLSAVTSKQLAECANLQPPPSPSEEEARSSGEQVAESPSLGGTGETAGLIAGAAGLALACLAAVVVLRRKLLGRCALGTAATASTPSGTVHTSLVFEDETRKAEASTIPPPPRLSGEKSTAWGSSARWELMSMDELKFVNELGSGGFGAVHKAEWKSNLVAAKVLSHAGTEQMVKFGDQELTALAQCRHPNIVTFYGVAVHQEHLQRWASSGGDVWASIISDLSGPRGEVAYVTELADLSLVSLLAAPSFATLGPVALLKIAAGTAQGLEYLHQRRPPIMHMDLKPGNILLKCPQEGQFHPCIGDFGSCVMGSKMRNHRELESCACTPGYIAPEMASPPEVLDCVAIDVFAYGLILLHLFSAEQPPHVLLVQEQFQRMMGEEIPTAAQLAPRLAPRTPPRVLPLILSVLAVDPDARPTVRAVSAALLDEHQSLSDSSSNDTASSVTASARGGDTSGDSDPVGSAPHDAMAGGAQLQRDSRGTPRSTTSATHTPVVPVVSASAVSLREQLVQHMPPGPALVSDSETLARLETPASQLLREARRTWNVTRPSSASGAIGRARLDEDCGDMEPKTIS